MALVYLNGQYCAPEQAAISPMDRGFLFGDGLYEVVPSYSGKTVGFALHIQRLNNGLAELNIGGTPTLEEWQKICRQVLDSHEETNLGLYIQVSRGVVEQRGHAYPSAPIKPTVFVYAFPIPAPRSAEPEACTPYRVVTQSDQRWQRCDVKTTSLLGNVLHYQHSREQHSDETLLFNPRGQLTEASTSNVFVLCGDTVYTAPLDNQLLPGITRHILLDLLCADKKFKVKEQAVDRGQLAAADEVWITSSSREVVPVISIDGVPVGRGEIGPGWLHAFKLYSCAKFNY
ncbi:MAG: aminotransferase class IV [Porticoccaceae bacterium]